MRASVLFVVVVGLFACGQAVDLKELGKNLLDNVVGQLKDQAVQLGQSLLSSLLGSLGKRDVSSFLDHFKGMASKLHDLLHAGKTDSTSVFGNAIDKLRAIANKVHAKLASLKDATAANDEVDDVVAEHHVQQKRILSDLLQKGKDLLAAAVDTFKGALSGLKEKASSIVSSLLQKGSDVLVGKRTTLSEHLQNIGGAISGAVSPFKDIIAGLGNTLKGHFSNLVDTVKGHVTALKGKLSGHVETLKTHGSTLLEHGKNALGALSDVVSDILKQTLANANPAINGLAKTASDAAGVVLGHLSGAGKTVF